MRQRGREAWAKWRRLVSEQKRSRQSVAFCRERGIGVPSFFAWKKRLNEAAAREFVSVQVVEAGLPPQPAAAAA